MTDTDHHPGQLSGGRRPPREPSAIRALPHDKHGRPIPWFAHIDEDGHPDHRVIRSNGIVEAVQRGLCWVCGTLRGRESAFVLGPMCAINRITAEPPSHRECAKYSADACPFLSTPRMRRRETGLPEERVDPAGVAVWRNPGVACVWFTNKWSIERVPAGMKGNPGILFALGDPTRVSWRAHGRDATREEILTSINGGFPLLAQAASDDRDPVGALAELERQREVAMKLLPAA